MQGLKLTIGLCPEHPGLPETWPVLLIFMGVIGGICGGFFTPTEAASIGTIATSGVALFFGWLKGRGLLECLYGAAQATATIFLILLGADVLNVCLALTQMPAELVKWVIGLNVAPAREGLNNSSRDMHV